MADDDRWTGAVTLFIEERGCLGRAGGEEDMPAEVWSNLPNDILQQVLSRLPIRDYVRCRTVCRSWKAMLSKSGVFRPPLCLCSILEPAATLEAIRLPQQLRLQEHRVHLPPPPVRGLLNFQCSYRGLLFFTVHDIPMHRWRATVCICNPLSKTWTKLARLELSCGGWLNRLLVQEDAVAAVSSNGRLYVHKGGIWRRMDWEPGQYRGLLHVVAEGVIYTLSEGRVHSLSVALDGREDDLQIAEPCNLRAEHWEVEHDGCFFLVGEMRTGSPLGRFGIWKLDREAAEWEHVSCIPDRHYQGMLLHSDVREFVLVWARSVLDFILLCVGSGDVDSQFLLGYHTQDQTWHVVSRDPDQVRMLNRVFPFRADPVSLGKLLREDHSQVTLLSTVQSLLCDSFDLRVHHRQLEADHLVS